MRQTSIPFAASARSCHHQDGWRDDSDAGRFSVTYTITASNAGVSNAPGATVTDTFPAAISSDTWTCVGAGGGTCPVGSGSGNISAAVNLPAGGSVTYTVTANISASATGSLSNTATVAAPAGVTDPNPGNTSATDTDTLNASADLSITKTDGVTTATPGGSVTYTITASNAGPQRRHGRNGCADAFPRCDHERTRGLASAQAAGRARQAVRAISMERLTCRSERVSLTRWLRTSAAARRAVCRTPLLSPRRRA